MARPERHDVDYFPTWKPQRMTQRRIKSDDYKTRYKALRNSSSAFIKRMDVRKAVFEKDGYKCVKCGLADNLQVDHIVSVYLCARGKYSASDLNLITNLQTLCSFCNSAKKPEGKKGEVYGQ